MKKSIYILAAASMMVACDPVVEDTSFEDINIKEGSLLKDAKIQQFEDAACTIPSETGNYIQYSIPGVSAINIYTIKKDGSEKVIKKALSSGGVLYYLPARGSELNQTLIFECINSDGTVIRENYELTITAAAALQPEVALFTGYGETKIWKWDTDDHVAWGNMGYCGGNGADVALSGNGQWWGIDFVGQTFENQQNHRGDDKVTGDDQPVSYMIVSSDGMTINACSPSGEIVRAGEFTITDYNPDGEWRKGFLNTNAILWPYEINSGGNIPGKYEIVYLTADKLCLVYPGGGNFDGLGGWGEASVWHFKAVDPQTSACGGDIDGKKWTWNTECPNGGVVWGNMGYCGGDGKEVYKSGAGKWWGVDFAAQTFENQQNHRGGDKVTGDDQADAYMIWTEKEIASYDGAGNKIRSGEYTFDTTGANEWKMATLNINSSDGAILWPYEINSGGNMPSKYDVVYISDDAMTLVYPDGGDFAGLGGWGEASFWQFKAVK